VLLIVGPTIDEQFMDEFESALVNKRGIVYIPGVPSSDLHAIVRDSFALVNSSVSEGMSTALLEVSKEYGALNSRSTKSNCYFKANYINCYFNP
jgi:hypothetical protein